MNDIQFGRAGAQIGKTVNKGAEVRQREAGDPLTAKERNALHHAMLKAMTEGGPSPRYIPTPSEQKRTHALNIRDRYAAWERSRKDA